MDTTRNDDMLDATSSDAAAIIDVVRGLHGTQLLQLEDPRFDGAKIPMVVQPSEQRLQSVKHLLDEYLPHPERRTGHASLRDQASFLDFTHRFTTPTSTVIFADPSPAGPKITAVFDYHEAPDGTPGFGQHRATLACQLSDEWKAWMRVNGETLKQRNFAAFLEDRIGDVILVGEDEQIAKLTDMLQARVGGPSALMTLARGLAVNVTSKVSQAITLETGEISLKYEEVHSDGGGAPITTPNLFFIAIPVFYGGAPYRIPVRIRYRVDNGSILWSAHLYRPDKALDDAFHEIVSFVRDGVAPGVPVFLGGQGA